MTHSIEKIKQEDINKMVWSACDALRGVVDGSQYKDYILTVLFLKYISDRHNALRSELIKEYGENSERIERRLLRDKFIVPAGASFYDILANKNAESIGEVIDIALENIEQANTEKLHGVFRNISFNSESNLGQTKDRNDRLISILDTFNNPKIILDTEHMAEDAIGEAYMFLVERFGADAGKKAGDFFTPSPISDLLSQLADPQPGQTIYDPACGAGTLLIKTAKQVGNSNYSLYGQEVNGQTVSMCRMNMFLHEQDSADIKWGNTLKEPSLLDGNGLMQFDTVVANPPFSLDKWGADTAEADSYNRFWRGIPPKSKGDYAFICHMIESAKRTSGKVAVIMPHGVLFRGSSEGKIRQSLIEENILDAVIGLPAGMFSTTGIPVCIMIFDRSRETGGRNRTRKDVLFIDASKEYVSEKKQNSLNADHIAQIVQTYKNRDNIEKYSHLASVSEIAENDYNLNIPRYVDTFEAEEQIDLQATQTEMENLRTEISALQNEMDTHIQKLIKG